MSQFIEMFGNTSKEMLGKFIQVVRGVSYKPSDVKTADDPDTAVILRSNNINDANLNTDEVVYINKNRVSGDQYLRVNDIVVCASNGSKALVGKAAINKTLTNQYAHGAFCLLVRPNDNINPVYLNTFFQTSLYKKQIDELAAGSNILNIKQEYLTNMILPLPIIEEQNKFAIIAEQADKSKFVGFKSQFIEMFGNPVANNKGWSTMALKQVAPEEPSRERQTGTVWILNLDMIESHTGKIIDKVYDEDTNLLSVAPFDEGNVLYSKLRPYLNKVVIPKGKGYATTELVPLRPNQEYLNLTFFSHLLRGDDFVTYANTISSGTKMPRMPLNDLRNFQCILPPMEEQLKFEKVAEQADKSEYYN